MKICGTNLVPIFVTIVFCGIIFVYFNMRLAEVKTAVEKQNRVLTAFITNVQNDIRAGGMMFGACAMGSGGAGQCTMSPSAGIGASVIDSDTGANHLASEEALQAVKRNEKIVVSDDEDDSEEEDDTDDESDDSEEEEDTDDDDSIIQNT